MNFKKSLIAVLVASSLSGFAHANDHVNGTEESATSKMDRLGEEARVLQEQLRVTKLKAAIATEQAIIDETKAEDTSALKDEIDYQKKEIDRLNDDLSSLISINNDLQSQSAPVQVTAPPKIYSVANKMFVTRIESRAGTIEAEIYYDGNFMPVVEGDDVIPGVKVASISMNGVKVKDKDGVTVKLKEKGKKRAIIEGLAAQQQPPSYVEAEEPPMIQYDPENGFMVETF